MLTATAQVEQKCRCDQPYSCSHDHVTTRKKCYHTLNQPTLLNSLTPKLREWPKIEAHGPRHTRLHPCHKPANSRLLWEEPYLKTYTTWTHLKVQ